MRSLIDSLEVQEFHGIYCAFRAPTFWQGVQILKCPLDLWIYQEILFKVKPDLVIETGTFKGGSALYFAHLMDIMGHGRIITIDTEHHEGRPQHPRLTYILGSSTAWETIDYVRDQASRSPVVMVVLDSDHSKDHVLQELRLYRDIVTRGSYMVLEDTNLNGHPVIPAFGPGPMEALEEFLPNNPDFQPDESWEKFLLSFNPKGYMRKS